MTRPTAPLSVTRAVTALSWLVIRVTRALPPSTSETRPTRPSPVITASSTSIPSPEPLSIIIVSFHWVEERTATEASTRS